MGKVGIVELCKKLETTRMGEPIMVLWESAANAPTNFTVEMEIGSYHAGNTFKTKGDNLQIRVREKSTVRQTSHHQHYHRRSVPVYSVINMNPAEQELCIGEREIAARLELSPADTETKEYIIGYLKGDIS